MISVNTPIRYVEVKSRRFLCSKCLAHCIETMPMLRAGMGKAYFAEQRKNTGRDPFRMIPLKCPYGHHKVLGWSWYDINDPKARKRFR